MTHEDRWRDWHTRGVEGLIASIRPTPGEVGITREELEQLRSAMRPDPDRLLGELGDIAEHAIEESGETRKRLAGKKSLRKIDEAALRTADLREYYATHLDAEVQLLKQFQSLDMAAVITHAIRAGALCARLQDLAHEPVATLGASQLKHAREGGRRKHREKDLTDAEIYAVYEQEKPRHETNEAAVGATIDRTGYRRTKIFEVIAKFKKN